MLVKLVTLEMASYASNSPERSYDQLSKRGNFDFFQVKTATRESEKALLDFFFEKIFQGAGSGLD